MKRVEEYGALEDFAKEKRGDKIYWTSEINVIGSYLFSFDKKIVYNLFQDYPYALTKEQKEIFDRENPYWANFFRGRTQKLQDSDE